jgi:hypothetical protein
MQHYATLFHVFDKAKSKKDDILQIDKQVLVVVR